MVTSTTLHPEVLWAQREDVLYITINLADAKKESIALDDTKLSFQAVAGPDEKPYAVDIEFYHAVNPSESKQVKLGRSWGFVVKKQESGSYWPRLLKDSKKVHWLKTDFSKWKDEDEEVDEANIDNPFGGGMDMASMMGGGMGGMGGMPGMGGMGGMDMASMMGGMGGMGGMDMASMMGGMGGMGGMPGMDMNFEEHDSDDEPEAAETAQQEQAEETSA